MRFNWFVAFTAFAALASPAALQISEPANICITDASAVEVINRIVALDLVVVNHFFEFNTLIGFNGTDATLNIINAPTTVSTTLTVMSTITTSTTITVAKLGAFTSIATATATDIPDSVTTATLAPTSMAGFVVQVSLLAGQKRQENIGVSDGQFIGPNGQLVADRALGTMFTIENSELIGNGRIVSTSSGTSEILFSPSTTIGDITTTFSIQDGALRWDNYTFFNGAATFCTKGGAAYIQFSELAVSDCTTINPVVVPVSLILSTTSTLLSTTPPPTSGSVNSLVSSLSSSFSASPSTSGPLTTSQTSETSSVDSLSSTTLSTASPSSTCVLPALPDPQTGSCTTASCTLPALLDVSTGLCATATCEYPAYLALTTGLCTLVGCDYPEIPSGSGTCVFPRGYCSTYTIGQGRFSGVYPANCGYSYTAQTDLPASYSTVDSYQACINICDNLLSCAYLTYLFTLTTDNCYIVDGFVPDLPILQDPNADSTHGI